MLMLHKKVVNIHPLDVQGRLERGDSFTIVDVRENAEVKEGTIPGAKHIPLSRFTERYHEIDPQKETILVCRSGNRSHKACEFLMEMGYSNVKNMLGGMSAWNGEVTR
ncbi:rhodanese-like domain-containing protein [Alicyclobacillus suci]|uniref:rhodanese-like domain-containing protein n=1 Tax=Alicyclobacillus suci TaxID=2816080 RepID=UPI001F297743|nr:rhodanese-like domain-containing protein [Alicyclobacillus suci]